MIFVSVGTDHHPFDRLLAWLLEACQNNYLKNQELIIQHGYTKPITNPCATYYDFLLFDQMMDYFKTADLVITHASSVALLVCHHQKMPVVIPRRRHLGEHIDDHQWVFLQETKTCFPFHVISEKEDLFYALENPALVSKMQADIVVGGQMAIDNFRKIIQEKILK